MDASVRGGAIRFRAAATQTAATSDAKIWTEVSLVDHTRSIVLDTKTDCYCSYRRCP